jgi:hypothetical protein
MRFGATQPGRFSLAVDVVRVRVLALCRPAGRSTVDCRRRTRCGSVQVSVFILVWTTKRCVGRRAQERRVRAPCQRVDEWRSLPLASSSPTPSDGLVDLTYASTTNETRRSIDVSPMNNEVSLERRTDKDLLASTKPCVATATRRATNSPTCRRRCRRRRVSVR